jgi:hypothetical protein
VEPVAAHLALRECMVVHRADPLRETRADPLRETSVPALIGGVMMPRALF